MSATVEDGCSGGVLAADSGDNDNLAPRTAPSKPTARRGEVVGVVVLISAAVLPYANTLLNSFVYDDITQVTNNPYLQSFRHLGEIFTTTVWSYVGAEGVTNYYRPMMTLGYLVCYQLVGPLAYEFHLMNVVLHAAVVLMLFALTRRMFGDRTLAFVTALVFALHPIHSESVAWIAAVTDLELTFFYLLAFWLYLGVGRYRAGESPSRRVIRHALLAGTFVLAVLSKEQALTLPFLATVYEHFYREDRAVTSRGQKLSRYLSLCLLAGAYLVFRVRFFGALAPASAAPKYTRMEALLSSFALLGGYVGKLLWPARLLVFYVFHKPAAPLDPQVLAGAGVLVLMAAAFLALYPSSVRLPAGAADSAAGAPGRSGSERTRPAGSARLASFGLVWLLATQAPVLNVRWMPANAFAERYLYLPSIGFCWIVAWVWTALWVRTAAADSATAASWVRRARWADWAKWAKWIHPATLRWALVGVLAVFVVLASARIWTRNRDWRNETTLFTRTLEDEPDAYPIRNNLGVVYWSRGDAAGAEREWRQSLRLAPTSVIIIGNLGMVCAKEKRYAEAVRYYRRAIELKPDYTNPHLNLGVAYGDMGLKKQAEAELEAAIRLSPLSVVARNRLGKLYADEGRLAEAERQFTESVRSEPNSDALAGLGEIYRRRGPEDVAVRAFRAALKLSPFDGHAHIELAAIEEEAGHAEIALREYETGLETDPGNAQARAAVQRLRSELRDGKR